VKEKNKKIKSIQYSAIFDITHHHKKASS